MKNNRSPRRRSFVAAVATLIIFAIRDKIIDRYLDWVLAQEWIGILTVLAQAWIGILNGLLQAPIA